MDIGLDSLLEKIEEYFGRGVARVFVFVMIVGALSVAQNWTATLVFLPVANFIAESPGISPWMAKVAIVMMYAIPFVIIFILAMYIEFYIRTSRLRRVQEKYYRRAAEMDRAFMEYLPRAQRISDLMLRRIDVLTESERESVVALHKESRILARRLNEALEAFAQAEGVVLSETPSLSKRTGGTSRQET